MKLSICAVTAALVLVLSGCSSANIEGWDIKNPDNVDSVVDTSVDNARSTLLSSDTEDIAAAEAWIDELKSLGFEVIADKSTDSEVSVDLRKGNTVASVRVDGDTVYILSELPD